MFDDNNVVHVVAPTGMPAFNVLGEPLHRVPGLDWKNMKKEMTKRTQEQLKKKLQNTIAILMDERSVLSQMNFGFAKKQLQEQRMNVDILLKTSDGGGSCHGLVWG